MNPLLPLLGGLLAATSLLSCHAQTSEPMDHSQAEPIAADAALPEGTQVLTLGAGCFWCVEAVYHRVPGVISADSGYMGGSTPDPTYEEVCTGATGHAEVVRVVYDPEQLPASRLLELFFELHDPTQLNRQGADVGTQYRSAIFYHDGTQKAAAEELISRYAEERKFSRPIVTEVAPAGVFYPAEAYHQEYWEKASGQNSRYCQAHIPEVLERLGFDSAPQPSTAAAPDGEGTRR